MTPELSDYEKKVRAEILESIREEIRKRLDEETPRGIIDHSWNYRLDTLPDRGLYDKHNPLKP